MTTRVTSRLSCLLDASNLDRWQGGSQLLGQPPTSCLGAATSCLGGPNIASMEPVTRTLVGLLLLTRGLLPNGSVLDVGAHVGHEACWYSALDPLRTVHAVEPLEHNIARMQRQRAMSWPAMGIGKIVILHAGLGSQEQSRVSVPRIRSKNPEGHVLTLWRVANASEPTKTKETEQESFPVHTVDSMFEVERLAFAHIDVEGEELNLLNGAGRTLARDRPWLTVEAHTNASMLQYTDRDYYVAHHVGKELARAQYTMYVIDEWCGDPGCRNILCVPEADKTRFEVSETGRLMHQAGTLTHCGEAKADALWECLQASVYRVREALRIRRPYTRPRRASRFNANPRGGAPWRHRSP